MEEYYTMIHDCAHKFKRKYPNISFDEQDLFQEGILHLSEIVTNYDSDRCKFSTYLYNQLRFIFLNSTKHDRNFKMSSNEILLEDIVSPTHSFPPEFINSLSREARLYVETVLHGGNEFWSYIERKSPKRAFKFAVGDFLGFNMRKVKAIEVETCEKLIY